MGTPDWLKQKIRAYYVETTEKSYLATWAKESLGFHIGLSDADTASNAESIRNTNVYLAERAGVGPGARVLDAGCGVGGSAFFLAEERGAEAVGITLVPEQVELGRQFAREKGLDGRVTFQCADMVATEFPEASFDFVWNMESMCHVFDLKAYLEHVFFLLRDGGRFACVDLLRTGPEHSEYEQTACEGWAMPPLRSSEEVAQALSSAGFVGVETEDLSDRALKSGQALAAAAHNAQLLIKAQKALLGEEAPLYEKHVAAGVAWGKGMEAGELRVVYCGGVRPPRGGSA